MELINKTHERIRMRQGESPAVSINTYGEFRFNSAACNLFGIQNGLNAHLLKDGKLWYVLFNNQPDGFPVREIRKKDAFKGTIFYSKPLVDFFTMEAKQKAPSKFYLQESDKKHNGQRLLEILVDKSVLALKKQAA